MISTLPSTIGLIIEKSDLRKTINGLYYLRDDDPLNLVDIGSLLKNQPIENESTRCGMFINFHFAELGIHDNNHKINNIYYRIWQKSPEFPWEGVLFELGYNTLADHNGYLNESIMIDTNEYISLVDNFRLIQALQIVNPNIAVFEGEKIYDFTIKSIGNSPNIRTFPNQYSFVILNLEDNVTLQYYDRDDDLLNDFDELFVHYTNPFDSDTDNDGFSDYVEFQFGFNPNDFFDNMGINTHPDTPTVIGPLTGKVGKKNKYKFLSSDPEGDDIYYYIKWGDNKIEKWIGHYSSGEEVVISHIWNESGKFSIRAKAKDIFGAESDWVILTVNISKNKIATPSMFQTQFECFLNLFRILQKILLYQYC